MGHGVVHSLVPILSIPARIVQWWVSRKAFEQVSGLKSQSKPYIFNKTIKIQTFDRFLGPGNRFWIHQGPRSIGTMLETLLHPCPMIQFRFLYR